MEPTAYAYFTFVLGGFGMVWAYRWASESKKPISDFEYLGFSTFWGLAIFGWLEWIVLGNLEILDILHTNPFATGAVSFLIELILGSVAGYYIGSKADWLEEKMKSWLNAKLKNGG